MTGLRQAEVAASTDADLNALQTTPKMKADQPGEWADGLASADVPQWLWIHGLRALEDLARGEYFVRQLASWSASFWSSWRAFRSHRWTQLLPPAETCHHPPLIILSPRVADSQSVRDHCPDGSPHLSHFRQGGDRRGCKVPRKPCVVVEQRGHWRAWHRRERQRQERHRGRALAVAPESAAGIVSKNPMALDGETPLVTWARVSYRRRSGHRFADCGSGTLPVHDEDLFLLGVLARRELRER